MKDNVIDLEQLKKQEIMTEKEPEDGDKEMYFTKEEWHEAARSLTKACPGLSAIIQAQAEKKKPGSGREVAGKFNIHMTMAVMALSFVAENFPDKLALVIHPVPPGTEVELIQ